VCYAKYVLHTTQLTLASLFIQGYIFQQHIGTLPHASLRQFIPHAFLKQPALVGQSTLRFACTWVSPHKPTGQLQAPMHPMLLCFCLGLDSPMSWAFHHPSTIHARIHPMPGKVLARCLPISALVCIEQPIFSASSRQCAFVSAPAPRPLAKGFILFPFQPLGHPPLL